MVERDHLKSRRTMISVADVVNRARRSNAGVIALVAGDQLITTKEETRVRVQAMLGWCGVAGGGRKRWSAGCHGIGGDARGAEVCRHGVTARQRGGEE
jgi:hypothetical protein